jgi:hypothetical protein
VTNFVNVDDPVPQGGVVFGGHRVNSEVDIHSVVSDPSLLHRFDTADGPHSDAIYITDTDRIIGFATDPSSALYNTDLGTAIRANTAYTGVNVQVMPGTDAADRMAPSALDSYVLGGKGDDVITLTLGNILAARTDSSGLNFQRAIDGGSGNDTLNVNGLSFLFKETAEGPSHYNLTSITGGEVADVSNVEALHFLDGDVSNDATSSGGKVYALYQGLLGRAPDSGGLSYWADQFDHGASPASLTAGFLASAEGQARLGSADNTGFVEQLYQNTLGRAADAGGLQYWTDQLAHGASRVDVADGFVFSAEHTSNLQPALSAGILVPDQNATEVSRIYYTMLGRAPDADGLGYWTDQIEHGGGSASSVAQAFLGTPENQAKYGSLSNSDYVDALYVNALGRHADSGGQAYWTNQLDHGESRADLAVQLSQSAEAQNVHLAQIEQGWHLA